ncbi:HAD-hyrolase-like protein [Scopulibacillus darangshiensis]|uniref:HAD-hyrolase-like protein n=1 Tax=Scopulibacillus darangshiensis TaxID=442528 RepID=A0A4R2P2I6_9BACL|nr:HAD family hydrolase [Scopulibacillus darangshiensis]TCP28939.1 HAD-hyrolase-like protein [Scopulibacillus darangshiensis]
MIETVLFDVDGVLLSEERYFDASALTVWELLYSNNYLGLNPKAFKTDLQDDDISQIREQVFQNDLVLKLMKARGLNANWDMIYLAFSHQLIHLLSQIRDVEQSLINDWLAQDINRETLSAMKAIFAKYQLRIDYGAFIEDFKQTNAEKEELLTFLNHVAEQKLGVKTTIFKRQSSLWDICEHASQEWYVGDENIVASTGKTSVQNGKPGFLNDEKTIGEPEAIGRLFQSLKDEGVSIGIGTGRPELETIEPFKHLGWLDYFDKDRIVTADDVLHAERDYPEHMPLAKPNPFSFIASLLGKQTPVIDCITKTLPLKNAERVLIVGDSLADLYAAKEIGCRFAAVLTGLSGKAARADFEAQNADYILDHVLDVRGLITDLKEN